jgi:hypothetical protein
MKRKPAAGYAPGDDMWETEDYARRLAQRRKANKAAKAQRRKNRR